MKLHYLLEKYHGLSYTHNYIMGRPVGGLVYAARLKGVDVATLVAVATLSKASSKNGGTLSVRFQPNLEQWAYITAHAVEIKVICTVEFLEKWAKEHGKNKGQAFEILTCEAWGGELPNAEPRWDDSGVIAVRQAENGALCGYPRAENFSPAPADIRF